MWSSLSFARLSDFYSYICDVISCALLPQASQPDELTIQEQEILELIDDGDMEDWVKVHAHQLNLYLDF